MLRRVFIIVFLFVLVGTVGMAQQMERAAPERSGKQALELQRKSLELPEPGRRGITIPDDGLESPKTLERKRLPGYVQLSERKPTGIGRHDGSNEHGVAEAHANRQLELQGLKPARPLFKSQASAEDCDRSQLALGAVLMNQRLDRVEAWGSMFGNATNLSKIQVDKLIAQDLELQRMIADYSRDCLSELSSLGNSPIGANLRLAAGVLLHATNAGQPNVTWGALCSATRIAPGLVLTAKHCFYNEKNGEMSVQPSTVWSLQHGGYKFVLPGLSRELDVIDVECVDDNAREANCLRYGPPGGRARGFRSDFVLLRVREPQGMAPPALTVSSKNIAAGSEIMLAGWNLFAAIADTATQATVAKADTVRLPLSLRLSRAGSCTIATVQNQCIVHTCQSSEGTSGAALFQYNADGSLRVVGLHVAPTDASQRYMGAQSCKLEPMEITSGLYGKRIQRYAGNVSLQLSP